MKSNGHKNRLYVLIKQKPKTNIRIRGFGFGENEIITSAHSTQNTREQQSFDCVPAGVLVVRIWRRFLN